MSTWGQYCGQIRLGFQPKIDTLCSSHITEFCRMASPPEPSQTAIYPWGGVKSATSTGYGRGWSTERR